MATAAATLADRLIALLELFLRTMAHESSKRRAVLPPTLGVSVLKRVRGLSRRFATLLALWQAGKLRPPRPRPARARPARPPDTAEERMRRRAEWAKTHLPPEQAAAMQPGMPLALSVEASEPWPAHRLPRQFAWLHKAFPESAPGTTGMFDSMLRNETEMRDFVAAVPQAGRVLRPLCHMFGLRPPDWLALPKRMRRRGRGAHPPPRPSPSRGEGEGKVEALSFTYTPPGTIKPEWMLKLDRMRERRMRALFRSWQREKRGE